MNRLLLWGLAGTVAVSAWALLNPRTAAIAPSPGGVVAAVPRIGVAGARAQAASASIVPPLPASWPEPAMEPGARSPFASAVAPPPPKPVAPAAVAPPPPPPPTPANYRFWGHLSSPDKRTLTFLARGADGVPVEIHTGTLLEDGWMVESIGDNAIVLAKAATQQRTTIFVPPADPAAMH